jgi:hypothetical protein
LNPPFPKQAFKGLKKHQKFRDDILGYDLNPFRDSGNLIPSTNIQTNHTKFILPNTTIVIQNIHMQVANFRVFALENL